MSEQAPLFTAAPAPARGVGLAREKGEDRALRYGLALDLVLPLVLLFAFILVSAGLRPLLAPDETRYLTVAWEMLLNRDFVVPTVNFAPYHHKPPLLFWLIDLSWSLFGVSRLAALGVVFAISASAILLTRRLAGELTCDDTALVDRIGWAMLGNAVFVIYCGLVLFDLLLTACVLGALLALLAGARSATGRLPAGPIALAGLCIGLGVLAKGPVVLVFVAWPVATYPLWRGERHRLSAGRLWAVLGLALLVALVPIAIWVVPALIETDGAFARALIWQQTAGRISGAMADSHARPFWFYLPLLPVFAMPWIFSPYVWREHRLALSNPVRSLRAAWQGTWGLRFLVLWAVPVVLTFSVIGGKQPHYLVPLLPAAVILSASLMRRLRTELVRAGALITLAVALLAQAGAAQTVFAGYDLRPLSMLVAQHDGPVAFVGDYQGEFGFLGRLREPLVVLAGKPTAAAWLAARPDGMLVAVRLAPADPLPGRTILDAPYQLDRRMAASVADGPGRGAGGGR